MKYIFLFFSIYIASSVCIYSQSNFLLSAISSKLKSYKSYKTQGIYNNAGSSGTFPSATFSILVKKQPLDTIANLSYMFDIDSNDGKDEFVYSDYSFYFTNNGILNQVALVDHPQYFKEKKMRDGVIPAVFKTPVIYKLIPSEIANLIDVSMSNENCKIIQKSDTIINNKNCICYWFIENYPLYSAENKVILCFEKNSFAPMYFQRSSKSLSIFQNQEASFTNTMSDFEISDNIFLQKKLKLKNNTDLRTADIDTPRLSLGMLAPDWQLPILGKNETLSLNSLKGKYIILEFTATWCVHCIEAIDIMNKLKDRYKNNSELKFVSIFSNIKDSEISIKKFSNIHKPNSTILYDGNKIEKIYSINSYPTFYIINPEGKVLKIYIGYSEDLGNKIIDCLNQIFH